MSIKQAIILAAGVGSRLKKYTASCHKALLPLQGKTLLEWQVLRLRAQGIENIVVVTGYAQEQFLPLSKKYQLNLISNDRYRDSNMVESLACCRDVIRGDCLICYGDLWYSEAAISKLLNAPDEDALAVDANWKLYWRYRYNRLDFDLEQLKLNADDEILTLGAETDDPDEQSMRYVGLIKLSDSTLAAALEGYLNDPDFNGFMAKPESRIHAYMTDLFNYLILSKKKTIKAIDIDRRWLEFDTVEDYELALDWPKMVDQTGLIL
ncbi:MAG: phosphocholine cytidylyltransferase family protein [Aestuariibacter sp.]